MSAVPSAPARPDAHEALTSCIETFRKWLHMPDPGHVIAVLAAAAANRAAGDPVWLLIIGGPSSGKTEAVMSLSAEHDVRVTGVVTEGGLLSATPKRERADGSKGGLLREIGDFGIVVLKDFTSILSMNRDTRAQVLAALREIYDGSWTRNVGTDGGRTLHWHGKMGLVAGCTGAFDTHYAVISSLGDRFLLYRLPSGEDEELGERSLAHVDHDQEMRSALAAAAGRVLAATRQPPPPSEDDRKRIVTLAAFACRARSAVERDSYTREITYIHPREAPGRLSLGLLRLLQGARAVGADEETAWRLVSKVARDCVPPIRLAVLQELVSGTMKTADLAIVVDYPTATVQRAAEDLTAHGVLARQKEGDHEKSANLWGLSPWARERIACFSDLSPTTGEGTYKSLFTPTDISEKRRTESEQIPSTRPHECFKFTFEDPTHMKCLDCGRIKEAI